MIAHGIAVFSRSLFFGLESLQENSWIYVSAAETATSPRAKHLRRSNNNFVTCFMLESPWGDFLFKGNHMNQHRAPKGNTNLIFQRTASIESKSPWCRWTLCRQRNSGQDQGLERSSKPRCARVNQCYRCLWRKPLQKKILRNVSFHNPTSGGG